MALDRWWPTAGRRRTGALNTVPRVVVKEGRLVPLAPSGEGSDWVFSTPLGNQPMVELPFSEIITLTHHLQAATIRSLLNRSGLEDIRDPTTPPPTAVDQSGRSAQCFDMVVQLVQGGVTRMAGVRGQDIYAVTAPIVIEAAHHLLAPAYQHSGALALAEPVSRHDLLRTLHGLFGDALPGSRA